VSSCSSRIDYKPIIAKVQYVVRKESDATRYTSLADSRIQGTVSPNEGASEVAKSVVRGI
jgi:hypothetical protein